MKVPRALIWCIRSKRFMSVACESVSEMALALLTTMSRPPKFSTVFAIASRTCASSRTSTASGSALPPAFSISSAAEWMVPGSLGLGSAVFAAMTTLAPSRAALSPMARPMPRDAPVMNRVLPERVSATAGLPIIVERQLLAPAAARGKPEPEKRSCPARRRPPGGRGRLSAAGLLRNLVEEADHVLDLAVGEHEDVAAFDRRCSAGGPERPGEPEDAVVSVRGRLQGEL